MLSKRDVNRVHQARTQARFIFSALLVLLMAPGCKKKTDAASNVHLTDVAARALFPEIYGSFARSSFARHERDNDWVEYRGEYLRGTQTLKITIDDVLSEASPEWNDEMQASDLTVAGHPARVMGSRANQRLSVAIGQRFRVSFRMANTTARQIKALAGEFDYAGLEALAR